MNLNKLSPASGSRTKAKRVGRGIGSGLGKTCGRGHKGQKARAGGYHKINFEGGQMPLQRRLPKMGFRSHIKKIVDEINLTELSKLDEKLVTMDVLKAAGLIKKTVHKVKIISSGELTAAKNIQGVYVTGGARKIIEELGGSIEQ